MESIKTWRVTNRTETITENTRLNDNKYGGWMCVNIGTGSVVVMGYELQPGEGLNFLDAVPAGSIWASAIDIVVNPGGALQLTRLQYQPVKD